jgi:hypothetical protein
MIENEPIKKKEYQEVIPKLLSPVNESNWLMKNVSKYMGIDAVCLSSKVWRGAVCYAQKMETMENPLQFTNVYIGWGIKEEKSFSPQFVLPVQDEYNEIELNVQQDTTIETLKQLLPPPPHLQKKEEEEDEDEEDE